MRGKERERNGSGRNEQSLGELFTIEVKYDCETRLEADTPDTQLIVRVVIIMK